MKESDMLIDQMVGLDSLSFKRVFVEETGLLLQDEEEKFYLLQEFLGDKGELVVALEAEKYLQEQGFKWCFTSSPLLKGSNQSDLKEKGYYLQDWRPRIRAKEIFRYQLQVGCEFLAHLHTLGEGFSPQASSFWKWPDWVRLFKLAQETVYELHIKMTRMEDKKIVKYFQGTARDALLAMDEAICHLKESNYYQQRQQGIERGYISVHQIPNCSLGMKYNLIEVMTPDLPACGLGIYLGQICDWQQPRVINDVIDLINIYHQIRPLTSREVELVKGFIKFPWQFWWATEQYFLQEQQPRKEKSYARELKNLKRSPNHETRLALQEL